MYIVYGLSVIILISSINAIPVNNEIVHCNLVEEIDSATFAITVNLVVKNENYKVVLDSGSAPLWLITKDYTMWLFDNPTITDTVLDWDSNCNLVSPKHTQIDPNTTNRFTIPKYVPDPANDITLDTGCWPTKKIVFGKNCWLIVIWNVYKEKLLVIKIGSYISPKMVGLFFILAMVSISKAAWIFGEDSCPLLKWDEQGSFRQAFAWNSCIKHNGVLKTWEQAKTACNEYENGHLLDLDSVQKENEFKGILTTWGAEPYGNKWYFWILRSADPLITPPLFYYIDGAKNVSASKPAYYMCQYPIANASCKLSDLLSSGFLNDFKTSDGNNPPDLLSRNAELDIQCKNGQKIKFHIWDISENDWEDPSLALHQANTLKLKCVVGKYHGIARYRGKKTQLEFEGFWQHRDRLENADVEDDLDHVELVECLSGY